jgi:hypothetical protein
MVSCDAKEMINEAAMDMCIKIKYKAFAYQYKD